MKKFIIDCFAENATKYSSDHAVVVVDVIRATTTATTAVSIGRALYPAKGTDEAIVLGKTLRDPLYVGELGGHVPYGFDLTNSPVVVMSLATIPSGFFTAPHRPLVLVSSSGMPALMNASDSEAAYVACLRNYRAVANYIATRHTNIAIVGAGTRGEFRREDQIGCSWVAEVLVNDHGFEPENEKSRDLVKRWSGVDLDCIREGNSANYLRRSGQAHDLEFVLHHIDDLTVVPHLKDGKLHDVQESA
jgi:2-phosphosulfolactate phosphatase